MMPLREELLDKAADMMMDDTFRHMIDESL